MIFSWEYFFEVALVDARTFSNDSYPCKHIWGNALIPKSAAGMNHEIHARKPERMDWYGAEATGTHR